LTDELEQMYLDILCKFDWHNPCGGDLLSLYLYLSLPLYLSISLSLSKKRIIIEKEASDK
jgi:hypothetical protein